MSRFLLRVQKTFFLLLLTILFTIVGIPVALFFVSTPLIARNQEMTDLTGIDLLPSTEIDQQAQPLDSQDFFRAKKVRRITITGVRTVPESAILALIPFQPGRPFKPGLAADLIKTIYNLGYFKPNIQILVDDISRDEVDITIVLEEKNIADDIKFEGNYNLKRDEIEKVVPLTELRGLDVDDLERISNQIRELYKAKDFHDVLITYQLIPGEEGRVQALFTIDEGKRTVVKRVCFQGNTYFSSKVLRKLIFTREDWPFGFLTKAGSFQPDALEYDKMVLTNHYQSNGFLTAYVSNVIVEPHPDCPSNVDVTFCIVEGDQYTVRSVTAKGNDLMDGPAIATYLTICPGELYSRERIRYALERLRLLWGEYGYIFAENDIDIQADRDAKTVDLVFSSTLNSPVTLNRMTIAGNTRTREQVIRREISLIEGELLTTRGMDESRERVERLGYFDPKKGVNWRVHRLSDTEADLELVLEEVKTGRISGDIKFGGNGNDIQSPAQSLQIGGSIQDSNFMGTGIRYSASGYFSLQDYQIDLGVLNPWLFGQPLQAGFNVFHRQSRYQDFRHIVTQSPRQQRTGGSGTFGFNTEQFGGLSCLFDSGAERITYLDPVIARAPFGQESSKDAIQRLLDRLFQDGTLVWIGAQAIQDYRNSPVIPTKGYLWNSSLKFGVPHTQHGFGFIKWDADAHWYTPLINDYDLIFHLHGHFGIIGEFENHVIPYNELYHIGGPASVRGFLFGQIGPTLLGDSLGAKKAFWLNAEVIFPIKPDFSAVGLLFYDGGAGWDTPNARGIPEGLLQNNQFRFRQAIGIGIKLRQPMPISIAVGLKLDRNKKLGESISEVHFSSAVDF